MISDDACFWYFTFKILFHLLYISIIEIDSWITTIFGIIIKLLLFLTSSKIRLKPWVESNNAKQKNENRNNHLFINSHHYTLNKIIYTISHRYKPATEPSNNRLPSYKSKTEFKKNSTNIYWVILRIPSLNLIISMFLNLSLIAFSFLK